MKRLILSALAAGMAIAATAQFQRIEVEEVVNGGLVPGTTYRVYAVLSHSEDHVHAIYGDKQNTLQISCTEPFYQHPDGGAMSRDVLRKQTKMDASLKYDSWFTIGLEDNYVNQVAQFMLDDGFKAFEEQGAGFTSNDGTWYATPDGAQVYARDKKRVLLMQLTTTGKVTATINLQGRTVGVSESGKKLSSNEAKIAEQDRLRSKVEAIKAELEKIQVIIDQKVNTGGVRRDSDEIKGMQRDFEAKTNELTRLREAFKMTNGELWKETGVTFTCG